MIMKGFIEDTIFIVIEIIMIAIFAVLLSRAVGAVFNPDKEVVTLNTELLRAKINEACQFKGNEVTIDKFALPQPKPSRIFGVTDFLPAYSISGSGAADPHYVLYYESFPPGEAIGWEAYERFDTRFIAPFDYAKVTGTSKLKNKGNTIFNNEVDTFREAMKDYEKNVLAKAESYAEEEFGEAPAGATSYTGDALPGEADPAWGQIGTIKEHSYSQISTDGNVLEISTPTDYDAVFVRQPTSSSESVWMDAKLKVTENKRLGISGVGEKIFISIKNAPYRADLLFGEGKIVLDAQAWKEYKFDTTKDFHVYKIEMNSGDVTVSIDDKPVPELSQKAKPATEIAFLWGAGNPDDPTKEGVRRVSTRSYWDSVHYSGSEISPELPENVKSELAKKPVLINNIILSDNLNVIPTEDAKPPGHEITKSVAQLGSAGQWNGDRFEFTDYFGLSKEERAYIKYEPCGENALCLKTRDAVQRFPLDDKCGGAQYIHMVYDARGMKWEDLVPAAYIVGEAAALRGMAKAQDALGKKAGEVVTKPGTIAPPSAASKPSTLIDPKTGKPFGSPAELRTLYGPRGEILKTIQPVQQFENTVAKNPKLLSKAIKGLGSFGKSALKVGGKKALGKGPGILKLALIVDIFAHQAPDLARNVMLASLEYKDSEFYLASPCKIEGDKQIKIKYEENCEGDEKLCEEGITYPLYEYKVEFDGTRSIANVGSHFMCLKAVGKDRDEPEEYKEKYKTERDKKELPENLACIKIYIDHARRNDFCWTNNPILPEDRSLWNKVKKALPGTDELIGAATGCLIGFATGGPVGCAGGAAFSLVLDEFGNVLDVAGVTQGGIKGELFMRLGGLPVTESTSYITYTEDEKKDATKKYLEAVEMGPTDVIGGGAAKRFGEITKDFFEIHWAWPR